MTRLTRRGLIAGAAALAAVRARGEGPMPWTVGAFNRVFAAWPVADALAGVRAAGYSLVGLLVNHPDDPMCTAAATPESIAALRERIAAAGLTANMTCLRYDPNGDPALVEADIVAQVEHAARLGVRSVMTYGVDGEERYARYFAWTRAACRAAAPHGMTIALKPHGGVCADGALMRRCLDEVAEPNQKVWYDAGNIIHYTGKDPVAELAPIAAEVTGFCAKDCAGPGGEVMMPFGTGRVDFKAVFTALAEAGFSGPVMVEGVEPGATREETIANAAVNREFLEGVLGEVGVGSTV